MAHAPTTAERPAAPLALHGQSVEGVDRCVHCGLCLAYCPTFSELGTETRAYGEYFGDGIAREGYEDKIVIYRDTLERDFGHDRALLAARGLFPARRLQINFETAADAPEKARKRTERSVETRGSFRARARFTVVGGRLRWFVRSGRRTRATTARRRSRRGASAGSA